ncbi:MAG TPA: 2-dehydropantoate 2-reductase [Hyphomicrobiaceae bacterium]|nr:2-dehydropantoate 2-reductase [Hyphomicrobiaceae bacterium]
MSFDHPQVAVIGAGAMGGLFGGLLAEGGLDVTLVDPWSEHVSAINARGLRIVGVGGDRNIPIKATDDASTITSADVVLFQCKTFANEAAARSVKHLFNGGTVAISFQNGLGNEETLGRILGAENVLGGLTAQAGLVEGPGVVRNFGDLPTVIGEMSGGLSDRARSLADAFTRHGLPTTASANIKRDKWKKLLGNVALGAVSAVTDLRSFEIMRVPELQEIVFRAVDEAAAVAKAEGVALDGREAREILLRLVDTRGGGTGASKSSMREDIIRRRRTEIDSIHGAVQRLARRHGVATPTIDTMIALVKGMQSNYLQEG